MSKIEEARKRIEEASRDKVLDVIKKGKGMQIKNDEEIKKSDAIKDMLSKVKPQETYAGDRENVSKSNTLIPAKDKIFNNVIEPMNQFNSSAFYNIGKLPAKFLWKTGATGYNILKGEEHPFQKAQEQVDTRFSNFEKRVGYDTSNKKENVQKANKAGEIVGNAISYIGSGKTLGGGALGFGAVSGMNAFANTNDIGDIGFSTAKGAIFGKINSATNNAVVKGIEKIFPATNPLSATVSIGGTIVKNAIAGGTGMYTATATTGELENVYNKARGREVTKEDWIKPIWSTETVISTLVGSGFGAISGTKADMNAHAKYENDVNELALKLKVYGEKFNASIQKGDQQSALDIVRASRDELVKFSMNKYGNRTPDVKVVNEVAEKWKTYLESSVRYYNYVSNNEYVNMYGRSQLSNQNINSTIANFDRNMQNNKDINKNTQNIEQSSQNNVQNVSNLENIVQSKGQAGVENILKNGYNQVGGVENEEIQRERVLGNNNEQTGIYKNSEQKQINKYTREQYNKFEQSIRQISNDKLTNNEKTLIKEYKNKYNKDIVFFENDSDYGGGASLLDGRKIYIDVNTAKEFGYKRIATHEVLESDILHDNKVKNIMQSAINDIINDTNFQKQKIEFWDKQEGELPSEYLIAKDIICDKFAEIENSEPNDYKNVLSKNTNAIIENAITEYKKIKNSNKSSFSLEKNSSKIQGLEDYTEQDIKDIVSDYVQNTDLNIKIKGIALNGSRIRGDSKHTSDLDVVLEYDGDISEDSVFNVLNEDPLVIDGIRVDINPITANKSGTLEEYMQKSKTYDKRKKLPQKNEETKVFEEQKEYNSNNLPKTENEVENNVEKRITKKIKEEIKNGLLDLGVENVDTVKESDYNEYKVIRKKEPNNYVYKKITDKDKTRVKSDYMDNKAKYEDDVGVVNFDDVSYSYIIMENDINILSKFKGSQKFINGVIEDVKNSFKTEPQKLNTVIENLRSNTRKNNITDAIGGKRGSIRKSSTHDIRSSGQQSRTNIRESNKNNVKSIQRNLENSNKSSFSLTKNQNSVKENSQEYEYTNEKEKLHIERAEEIFGYTDDFEKAGYLTWYGELLDFSDGSDRRIEDHRAINQVFDETFDSNSDYLIKFMNEGNIRINPETPGLEISNFTETSNAQLDMIEEYADWNKYGGYFVVDFCNKYGDNIGSLEYENNINPSQIIDDINEFFRTGELPIVEETNNQYDNQITIEDTLLEDTNYISSESDKPKIVGQRYWQGFHEQGYIDLNGKEVRNAQDVAELSQIFRNPKYETFRVIYTKGNTIVGQEAVSSHLPNSSRAFTDENTTKAFYKMKDRMKRLNADGYYMVHNHPAGTAKASRNDIKLTKKISDNVQGFKGHIVVDHETYAYIFRDDLGMNWKNELKVDDKNALYKGSQFETSLPSSKVPWNDIKIESRDDLASLMHNLKNDTNYSTMILCDTQLKINTVIDIPNKFFNMRTKHIEGYIRNIAKQYGATDAFIGTPDKNVFDKIKKLSNVKDTILYKDNTTKFKKGNEIFVGKNDIAVRVGEGNDIELTKKIIIDTITEGVDIDKSANKDVLQRIASSVKKMIKNGSFTINEIEKIIEDVGNLLSMRTDEYFGNYNDLKQELRKRKLYVPSKVKADFTDWNEFRKQNIGRLRLTNDEAALPIDTFYQELSEKYGQDLFPDSIINISDQLKQISDIADKLKIINVSLKKYFSKIYGYGSWEAFAEDLKIKLIELRNEYEEENNTQDKKALVASEREKQILISQGITEMEIKDPANGYVQNILKTLRSDSEYYDRTLKEIEETNYADTKRTNYLLRKRRWDILKSGKADLKYSRISNFTDMRKEIEKDIGKSIKEKGFRKRAYGIYQIREDEIRVKDLSNIETITHELGHKIDYTMLKRAEQQNENMSNELNELAERAFGNMYDNDIETKNREGWAEFVRRFITNNEITQKEYPVLSRYFEEEMTMQPKLKNMVVNLISMVEAYVNAPSSSLMDSMISVGEQTDRAPKENLFDKFMYQYFDDAWYIQKLERNYAKKIGTHISKLKTEHNIYDMHRLYKGNEVSLQNILMHGFRDNNGFKITKGLTEIFEPFEKSPEKIGQIRSLLIARRGLDYMSRGLELGILSPDILNTLENIKAPDVIKAVNEIQEFAEEPLKMAQKSGMITAKDYEELKKWNKYYVPLKRVFDEQKASSRIGKGASKLYKERKGSLRTIIDPIESIVQNTAMLISKIKHNEIMVELSRQAEQTNMTEFYNVVSVPMQLKNVVSAELFKDALEEQLIDLGVDTESIDYDIIKNVFAPKLADDKSMTLTFMENGEMKAIQFYDKHLYDFFAEASSGIAKNALEIFNVLDKATNVLRAGATAKNLEFTSTNIVKDTVTAGFYSEAGFVPGIDTIRGMVDFLIAKYGWGKGTAYSDNKINLFDYYQQSGAPMSTRVASYREGVQDYLKEAVGKYILDLNSNNEKTVKKAITGIWKGLKASADKIGDIMEFLPELSEQGTRFKYFEKAYNKYIKQGYTHKQAMLQAGIDSKDITLDFNRAGNSMRAVNRLIAFSNAKVQGVYRALLGIEKGIVNKKYGVRLLFKSAILIALTLAVKYMSDKDKEVEEIQQQVKLDNWVFKVGDTILKIPKAEDFTLRTSLNLALTIFDVIVGNKEPIEASNEFLFETANSLAPIDIENIANSTTPTAVKPTLEVAVDKDFYYGNQITPYGTEDLSSQNQYDYKTSLTARKLGQTKLAKLLNLSPAKLDHLGKGYGAGVEQQIVKITDKIIDFFDDDVILPKDSNSEKLFIRRFVIDPDRNSQSVSDVYDMYDELNIKYQDYDKAEGSPLTDLEKETFKKLKTAKETLSKINKEIKNVTNSLELNAEEKRVEIDRLKALRTDTARYYLNKELINIENTNEIELYEYYPANEAYTYTPPQGLKVKVKYEESDKKEYAELCMKKYRELIIKTKAGKEYKSASEEEKENLLKSDLSKARNYAKDIVSKKIYERGR